LLKLKEDHAQALAQQLAEQEANINKQNNV
jgi:hypothetical protein